METRSHALVYARRGLPVFRLFRGSKDHFVDTNWAKGTTYLTPFDVYDAWTKSDGSPGIYNIGVVAGDNIVIIDIDNKNGVNGFEWLKAIGGLDETFAVQTGNNGLHLHYENTDRVQYGQAPLAPGVDIRSGNGYVVGAGSVVNGKPYKILKDVPIAPLPEKLKALLRERKSSRQAGENIEIVGELDTPETLKRVEEYLAHEAPEAVEGASGNNTTYAVACRAIDMGVSPEACLELMLDHYNERCFPPWDVEELQRVVNHAYEYRQAPIGRDNLAGIYEPIEDPPPELGAPRRPVPFALTELEVKALPERPWFVWNKLLRKQVTVIGAPGSAGKSLYSMQMACGIALGDEVLQRTIGATLKEKTNVLIINNEDPFDELMRRMAAICQHYKIPFSDLHGKIHFYSGVGEKFKASRKPKKFEAAKSGPDMIWLAEYVKTNEIGVVMFDPLISIHESAENDNGEMDKVMDVLTTFANNSDVAVLLSHHTAKPGASSSGLAGDVNVIRGAAAIKDAARVGLTMFTMSEKDAVKFGVPDSERHRYVRVDDAKMNLSLVSAEAEWFRRETIKLPNGDAMGVLQPVKLSPAGEEKADKVVTVLGPMLDDGKVKRASALAALLKKQEAFYFDQKETDIVAEIIDVFKGKSLAYQGRVIKFEMHGKKDASLHCVKSPATKCD